MEELVRGGHVEGRVVETPAGTGTAEVVVEHAVGMGAPPLGVPSPLPPRGVADAVAVEAVAPDVLEVDVEALVGPLAEARSVVCERRPVAHFHDLGAPDLLQGAKRGGDLPVGGCVRTGAPAHPVDADAGVDPALADSCEAAMPHPLAAAAIAVAELVGRAVGGPREDRQGAAARRGRQARQRRLEPLEHRRRLPGRRGADRPVAAPHLPQVKEGAGPLQGVSGGGDRRRLQQPI